MSRTASILIGYSALVFACFAGSVAGAQSPPLREGVALLGDTLAKPTATSATACLEACAATRGCAGFTARAPALGTTGPSTGPGPRGGRAAPPPPQTVLLPGSCTLLASVANEVAEAGATSCRMPCVALSVAGSAPARNATIGDPAARTPPPPLVQAPAATGGAFACLADRGDPGGTADRDLSGAVLRDATKMTNELCRDFCARGGFPYSATQYGGHCFCGHSYGRYAALPATCNMGCSGRPDEVCGGEWANSVSATGVAPGGAAGGERGGRTPPSQPPYSPPPSSLPPPIQATDVLAPGLLQPVLVPPASSSGPRARPLRGYEIVQGPSGYVGPQSSVRVVAPCTPGRVVLGGGLRTNNEGAIVTESGPDAGERGHAIRVRNADVNPFGGAITVTPWAVCVDPPDGYARAASSAGMHSQRRTVDVTAACPAGVALGGGAVTDSGYARFGGSSPGASGTSWNGYSRLDVALPGSFTTTVTALCAAPPADAGLVVAQGPQVLIGARGRADLTAACPAGTRALSGGVTTNVAAAAVYNSLPRPDGSGWDASIHNPTFPPESTQVTARVQAICAVVN